MPEFLGDREVTETHIIPGRQFFTAQIQNEQLLITNVRDDNRLMGFSYAEARALADFIDENVPQCPEADADLSDYTSPAASSSVLYTTRTLPDEYAEFPYDPDIW